MKPVNRIFLETYTYFMLWLNAMSNVANSNYNWVDFSEFC